MTRWGQEPCAKPSVATAVTTSPPTTRRVAATREIARSRVGFVAARNAPPVIKAKDNRAPPTPVKTKQAAVALSRSAGLAVRVSAKTPAARKTTAARSTTETVTHPAVLG